MAGWVAPAIAAAEVFNHPCVIGKSMLMERSALESMGGVNTGNALAEDYLIGSAFHEMGYTVKMAPKAVQVHLDQRNIQEVFNRYLRWAKMQRKINFRAFVSEWLLCATPWAVLGFYAALSIGNTSAALLIASLFTLRSMGDVLHASRHENAWTLVGPWMPIRDSFALAMWFGACLSDTINWKGRKMRSCEEVGLRLFTLPARFMGRSPDECAGMDDESDPSSQTDLGGPRFARAPGIPESSPERRNAVGLVFSQFSHPHSLRIARVCPSRASYSRSVPGHCIALRSRRVPIVETRPETPTTPDPDRGSRSIGGRPDSFSMPSGHTTAAFSAAVVLATLPGWEIAAPGMASLVGISRMYMGAHYPTDVAAGAVLGSVCGFLALAIPPLLQTF